MLRDVTSVSPLGGYRLGLEFDDGTSGEVDLATVIDFTGVFEPLRDPEYFARVAVNEDLGTIYWPNGADLDPNVLYSRVTGEPIEAGKAVTT
jgi:hypothetical protein